MSTHQSFRGLAMMRRYGLLFLIVAVFALVGLYDSRVDAAPTEEVSYTFEIPSVPISRTDDRVAVVDIAATLVYKPGTSPAEYPDIRPIVEDVRTFVRTYPERKAYFEVIAKEAASRVINGYPVVSSVTVVLVVHVDEGRSYKRIVRAMVVR